MYKSSFGSKQQLSFNTEAEFYEFLGFLTKNDGTSSIVWEPNNESGAWAQEGRILFYKPLPPLVRANLLQTAGNGKIVFRVNCNEFVEAIRRDHEFNLGENQDVQAVRNTVPVQFLNSFNTGRQF